MNTKLIWRFNFFLWSAKLTETISIDIKIMIDAWTRHVLYDDTMSRYKFVLWFDWINFYFFHNFRVDARCSLFNRIMTRTNTKKYIYCSKYGDLTVKYLNSWRISYTYHNTTTTTSSCQVYVDYRMFSTFLWFKVKFFRLFNRFNYLLAAIKLICVCDGCRSHKNVFT